MSLRLPFAAFLLPLILVSCAGPEFQPYSGPAVQAGTGGYSRIVSGMPVWDGTPPRKFQILGMIQEEGGSRATSNTVLKDIVAVAKLHGADAILLIRSGRGLTGVDLDTGGFIAHPFVKTVAIKYL
jgi:hypothetical protein